MSSIEDQLEDSFFEAFNEGREAEANIGGLDFGVWSAVLDDATCAFCEWANGRFFVISQDHLVPPAHFNCRCLIAYYNQEDIDPGEQPFLPWEDPPSDVYPFGSK